MAKKLYVGNLSYEATGEDLTELFSQHGEVESANIILIGFPICQFSRGLSCCCLIVSTMAVRTWPASSKNRTEAR